MTAEGPALREIADDECWVLLPALEDAGPL